MSEHIAQETPFITGPIDPALQNSSVQPTPTPPALQHIAPKIEQQDIPMVDAFASPAPQQPSTVSTPHPLRNATPVRHTNGVVDVIPMPTKSAPHGAPARRFLNDKVTGVLMEGVKRLAMEQPEDPLRALGEYLLQRSRELENSQAGR